MQQDVSYKVAGGKLSTASASTIADLKQKAGLTGNYTAAVNGETVTDSYTLEEGDFVTFAPAVKGGC